jgi:TonB family protein
MAIILDPAEAALMSAATATALALERPPRRVFQRHPINTPLDLIVLRSGVPETLPGRCTDISEAGVGAVVAGELVLSQHVAIELRLPNVGLPIRVRAVVRYQSRLHCGFDFVGLSVEQREMIRYWIYRSSAQTGDFRNSKKEETIAAVKTEASVAVAAAVAKPGRKIRIVRRGFYVLTACVLVLAGLGWWQWQKSWNELERQSPIGESGMRVSPEAMEKRIVTKIDPLYPEAARATGTQGTVVLDAVIGPDGSVRRLRPVSGADLLVRSATDAVQLWKFEPYLASGKAVAVETRLAVEFRLN